MDGYFLNAIDGEQILVFRSEDHEEIYRIIARLAASRDKEIRALATNLEIEWCAAEHAVNKEKNAKRLSSNAGPKNGKAGPNRTRN